MNDRADTPRHRPSPVYLRVDRITRAAQLIHAHNLAKRLPLRGIDDELERLSETLNGMFARLDDAFRRIRQFTADASHELRTPVAIIRSTVEITRAAPRTAAEYAAALDRILAETERTSRLIDDLLLLARADAEADRKLMEPMDLAIEICDSGVGIAAQDLAHIFERFYRVAADRSRTTGGVGLGLAIAEWIATCHNGRILVESGPGAGSVFRVALPLVSSS
jgi:signal transduction histidine kinase